MMTKEGLKESINGDNEGGGEKGVVELELVSERKVHVVGKENKEVTATTTTPMTTTKAPPPVPSTAAPLSGGRKVSVGEPMGLPNEHLIPPSKPSPDEPSSQKNGLKRGNSGRTKKCKCWCCCCTCSCLNPKNTEAKGKESEADLICDPDPPPSLDEIRGWGESFDKLMRSGGGRKVFRDFLKCEYSEENILFWLACEELKKERAPDVIEEKARGIYEDYISILSPKEVSLDSRVRDVVNRNMGGTRLQLQFAFDEAQLQIYTLMHRDSYPRFVNSPLFKKMAQLNPSTPPGGGGSSSHRGSADASAPSSRKQSSATPS